MVSLEGLRETRNEKRKKKPDRQTVLVFHKTKHKFFHRSIPGLNTALHSSSLLSSGNDMLLPWLSPPSACADLKPKNELNENDADFNSLVRKIWGRCWLLSNDITGFNLRAVKVENDRRRMNWRC
jgi:hypothetical protein